eukprot:1140184-Amphidinium_carterae.1
MSSPLMSRFLGFERRYAGTHGLCGSAPLRFQPQSWEHIEVKMLKHPGSNKLQASLVSGSNCHRASVSGVGKPASRIFMYDRQ